MRALALTGTSATQSATRRSVLVGVRGVLRVAPGVAHKGGCSGGCWLVGSLRTLLLWHSRYGGGKVRKEG